MFLLIHPPSLSAYGPLAPVWRLGCTRSCIQYLGVARPVITPPLQNSTCWVLSTSLFSASFFSNFQRTIVNGLRFHDIHAKKITLIGTFNLQTLFHSPGPRWELFVHEVMISRFHFVIAVVYAQPPYWSVTSTVINHCQLHDLIVSHLMNLYAHTFSFL